MKTIIWDFNGTIIDDLDLCVEILNEMLIEAKLPMVTKERYLEVFTFPIKDYYQQVGFNFDQTPFNQLASQFISKYQKKSLEQGLHRGVISAIKELKIKGYRQVLLSASQIDNLYQQLKHFQLVDLFDTVLGINDIQASSKVQVGIDYFQEYPLDPLNSYLIGDTLHDAEVASALNCGIILYTKGHQAKSRLTRFQTIDSYEQIIKEIEQYGKSFKER